MLSDGIIGSMVLLNPSAKLMCVFLAEINWINIHYVLICLSFRILFHSKKLI